MYRDADFDKEDDVRSTASCFEGLKERDRYLPGDLPKLRRTSSEDDVSRYHRHYELARRHCGRKFTLDYYASLLHDAFRHWRTPEPKSFPIVSPVSTMSERSAYFTAHDSDGSYYSVKKMKAEVRHVAKDLVKSMDRVLNLHPTRSETPPFRKKRPDKPKVNKTPLKWRGGKTSDSDSSSSTSSLRPPCGAGDSGTRKKNFFRFK